MGSLKSMLWVRRGARQASRAGDLRVPLRHKLSSHGPGGALAGELTLWP